MRKNFAITVVSFLFLTPAWAEEVPSKEPSEFWLSNPDQFVFDKIAFQEAFYIPKASLELGPHTVAGWFDRLTNHFVYAPGGNVLLHFEGKHYSKKSGGVLPNYAVQINLEVPAGRFKKWERIDAKDLQGYISWIHPDFPKGDLYIPISEGYFQIWKITGGKLYGHFNLKFEHEKLTEPIHVYDGRVRAERMTKTQYAAAQGRMREDLYKESAALDEMPVPRELLKPPRKYPRRGGLKKEGARSSSAWQ